MSFEHFGKQHLYCSDHASPAIVGFDLLDAFSVGEPEGSSEDVEEFILVLGRVLLTQKVSWWALGMDFDGFPVERSQVGMFDWI